MDTGTPPKEAKNANELLELIRNEKKRIRYALYQPHLLSEMKTNVIKIADTLKYSVDKAAILVDEREGINALCKEMSKYISILTIAVKIINYGLCECAANELIKAVLHVFNSIHKLFAFIHNKHSTVDDDDDKQNDDNNSNNPNQKTLATLVGVVWEQLKNLKAIPLDNATSIGRQIMSTLTVIRDAKKEVKQSIKDLENNECILKLNPWTYDYTKLESMQNENDTEAVHTIPEADDAKQTQNDDYDDDILLFGDDEVELSELQSLRVYQIYECIIFVDEVINHIYLFIIKHFKESSNGLDAQKRWLTHLAQSIALLPNYVDELSCCIYSRPPDEEICKNASNLLHFLWKIAIEIADESQQYKTRKMVMKNKRKKSKTSLTGYEWKCKFIDHNLKIGQMFALLTMEHVHKYIANDAQYNKHKAKKQHKKKNKKQKRKDKTRLLKRNKSEKKDSMNRDVSATASSQKEAESNTPQPNNDKETNIESQPSDHDDMVNVD
eukprot:738282_1